MQYHRGDTALALQFSKWLQGIPEGVPRQQVDEMTLCVCVVIELSHITKMRLCSFCPYRHVCFPGKQCWDSHSGMLRKRM